MPNYVKNRVIVEGNPEDIDRMFKEIGGDDEIIDFNKIIPMPDDLAIEHAWGTSEAAANHALLIPPKFSFLDRPLEKSPLEMDDDQWNTYIQMLQNYRKHGHPYWHSWRVENWGTKRNAGETSRTEDGFDMETAWMCPFEIFEALVEKYPSLTFTVYYTDEDYGSNCGVRKFSVGNQRVTLYAPTGNEAVKFAYSVWNIDPTKDYEEVTRDVLPFTIIRDMIKRSCDKGKNHGVQ